MQPTPSPTRLAVVLALAAATSGGAAQAFDARAVALGGSVIAAGEGVPGALANPSALMGMQRAGQRTHFSVGLGGRLRDEIGVQDLVEEEEGLPADIEDEVERVDASAIECEPQLGFDPDTGALVSADFDREDVCLDGLGGLADLSSRSVRVLDDIGGKDVVAQGSVAVGLGFTGFAVPFALHVQTRATGRGRADVTENDRDYVRGIGEAIDDDGELLFGAIEESRYFDLDPPPPYTADNFDPANLPTIDAALPRDSLDSTGNGGAVLRVSLGASFAGTFDVGGHAVDVGVTPKLSSLIARGVDVTVTEFLDDDDTPFEDRFEDSEVTATSFTFDLGASVAVAGYPARVAAVLRNVVPESIETEEGIEFETTPQLVLGGVLDRGPFTFNADLALNEAEVDSLPTRMLAIGTEFEHGILALRGGLNHEAAREDAATALTLGVGLGPFDIGARVSDLENIAAGAQLSLSF